MQIEIVNSRKEKLIIKIILYLTIGCCPHEIMKIKAERQLDCNWRGDKNQEGMALRRTGLHEDLNSLWKKKPQQQKSRWRRSWLIYIFRR